VTTAASSLAVTLREASVDAIISREDVVPVMSLSRLIIRKCLTIVSGSLNPRRQSGCRYNARNVPTDCFASLISPYPRVSISVEIDEVNMLI